MYYCFLRGKRNELLAIRDSATKIQQSGTNIILEPVNDNFNEILTALNTVDSANNFILLANPKVGNLVNNTNILIKKLAIYLGIKIVIPPLKKADKNSVSGLKANAC